MRLSDRRKETALTQSEVAERIGVSQNTVCTWEIGTRRVPVEFLPKLARLYGCTIEELFDPEELKP